MGRISVGEALSAGFRLIGREPAAVAVWCSLYLVVSLAPLMVGLPETVAMYRAFGSGAQLDEATMLAASQRMGALQPLAILAGLAVLAVLPTAVFRAELFPNDRRRFYLRLGMREFWVLIVTLVVGLIWIAALMATMIPMGIVIFAGGLLLAAGGGGSGVAALGGLLFVMTYLAAISVAVWIVLRFSMAPVLSFAENTFRVPESWRLTKGHAWRVFLVGLGLFAIVFGTQLVLMAAGFAALAAGAPNAGQTLQTNPAAILSGIGAPAIVVASLVFGVMSSLTYVIGAAAWADIYRQLKPPLAETFS